jgi:hypothetical protein
MSACAIETIDEFEAPHTELPGSATDQPPRAESEPARRPRRSALWILAVPLAAASLAAGYFLTGAAAAPVRIEPLPFGFQAQQQRNYVALRWDGNARAVREARRAILTIQDGPESEDVELDLGALRRGALWYQPVFGNVAFRLALAGASHRTVSERAQLKLGL